MRKMCETSTVLGTQRQAANGSFPSPHGSSYLCSSMVLSNKPSVSQSGGYGDEAAYVGQQLIWCSLKSFVCMKFSVCFILLLVSLYPDDSNFHIQSL